MKERGNHLLRFVDRYVGIPLVLLFSLRIKRKLPKKIESIAILKSAGIGDLIFMSGVIQDILKAHPRAKIWLFTGKANAAVGRMIEGVELVVLPMTNPIKTAKIIRNYPVDLWIDADPWPRISTLLTLCSRSKFHIGFRTPKQMRHFPYDCTAQHSPKDHEIDSLRRLMVPLQIPTSSMPKLKVPAQKKRKLIVLHQFPGGSRANLKKWDKWQALANYFIKKGYRVVTTGGKEDVSTIKGVENRVGLDSLEETAKLVAQAFAVVTIDTGILHLSAALGSYTIALHGPTFPHRCGGLGENVCAITPKIDYTPCIYLGFEAKCKSNNCMRAITLTQVTEAFEKYESSCISRRERDEALAHFA